MGAEKAATIEVAAQKLSQLFNSPDPSPFAERDLDTEAAAFIVSWAKELAPCDRYRGLRQLKSPSWRATGKYPRHNRGHFKWRLSPACVQDCRVASPYRRRPKQPGRGARLASCGERFRLGAHLPRMRIVILSPPQISILSLSKISRLLQRLDFSFRFRAAPTWIAWGQY